MKRALAAAATATLLLTGCASSSSSASRVGPAAPRPSSSQAGDPATDGLVAPGVDSQVGDAQVTADACTALAANIVTLVVLANNGVPLASSKDPGSATRAAYPTHNGLAQRIVDLGTTIGESSVSLIAAGDQSAGGVDATAVLLDAQARTKVACSSIGEQYARMPAPDRATGDSAAVPEATQTPGAVITPPPHPGVAGPEMDYETLARQPCPVSFAHVLEAVSSGAVSPDQVGGRAPDEASRALLANAAATVPEILEFGHPPKEAATIASYALVEYCLAHPQARAR